MNAKIYNYRSHAGRPTGKVQVCEVICFERKDLKGQMGTVVVELLEKAFAYPMGHTIAVWERDITR